MTTTQGDEEITKSLGGPVSLLQQLTISTEIARFMERPIQITTITGGTPTTFYPWNLWAANAAVIAKLRNYYGFRGTANLLFTVQAEPFTYGSMQLGLSPVSSFGGQVGFAHRPMDSLFACTYNATIDYSQHHDVHLKIPYFATYPWMSIQGATGLTNHAIYIDNIQPPISANSAIAPTVYINVYMYVTKYEVTAPFAQSGRSKAKVTAASQAKRNTNVGETFTNGAVYAPSEGAQRQEDDGYESAASYGSNNPGGPAAAREDNVKKGKMGKKNVTVEQKPNGMISSMATKFSKVANSLSAIPVIGGYAAAASTVASGIGKIAAWFGFSKPLILSDFVPTVRRITGQTATCIGSDTAVKLTVDPKAERSISGMIVDGTTEDQMSFAFILGHRGLLNFYAMTSAQAAGTVIASFHVAPGACRNTNPWTLTPLAHTSLAFSQWSGSLVYSIQTFCSPYHRGRLRIYWNRIAVFTDPILNTTISTLLEVAPGAVCEFIVPWDGFSPTRHMNLFDLATPLATPTGSNNGFLFIEVDQPLVSPRAAADIYIVVQVKAGPDFKLYDPCVKNLRYASWNDYANVAQATLPVPPTLETPGIYVPVAQSGGSTAMVHIEDANDTMSNLFGESITSWRLLCKRYCWTEINYSAGAAAGKAIASFHKRLPCLKNVAGGTGHVFGFSFIAYLAPCYALFSGSTRIKVVVTGDPILLSVPVTVTRATAVPYFGVTPGTVPVTGLWQRAGLQANGYSAQGSYIADVRNGQSVEVEIPDSTGNPATLVSAAYQQTQSDNGVVISQMSSLIGGTVGTEYIENVWYAAGEDFNLYCYFGPPLLYFYGDSNL